MGKLIYVDEHPETYKHDTWVELIGEGHYAITQTTGFDKKQTLYIYLTRKQMEAILKEEEIKK